MRKRFLLAYILAISIPKWAGAQNSPLQLNSHTQINGIIDSLLSTSLLQQADSLTVTCVPYRDFGVTSCQIILVPPVGSVTSRRLNGAHIPMDIKLKLGTLPPGSIIIVDRVVLTHRVLGKTVHNSPAIYKLSKTT